MARHMSHCPSVTPGWRVGGRVGGEVGREVADARAARLLRLLTTEYRASRRTWQSTWGG